MRLCAIALIRLRARITIKTRMPQNPDHARALRDALRRLLVAHGSLDETQRPCGAPLSTSHAWALLELRDSGPMTVTSLAERLNIDRTNVSRLCARMESEGEVERIAHPHDGRARILKLTSKGSRVAKAVDRSSTDHFALVLDRLDADVVHMIENLDTLTRAIRPPSDQENCA